MNFFRASNTPPYPPDDPHGFMARNDAPHHCRFCGNHRSSSSHIQEPAGRETGQILSTSDQVDQLKSPMNLALYWDEAVLSWVVIIRYHGKRIGVTQVDRLDDLGTAVFDYVSLASDEPLNPNAAVTNSLLPQDFALVVARIREVIVDFGQLGTPGANNEVTALDTIELIDELFDDPSTRPATGLVDQRQRALDVVHGRLCGCDTWPAACLLDSRVTGIVDDLVRQRILRPDNGR